MHGLMLADGIYAIPLGILMGYTYFRTIPRETIEAARIDGASQLRIFLELFAR